LTLGKIFINQMLNGSARIGLIYAEFAGQLFDGQRLLAYLKQGVGLHWREGQISKGGVEHA